jgi:ribosome maturation factor RimP
MDVEDWIPFSYTLEVSSPGLDRPLVKEADFRRFAGKKAKVRTRTPIEGENLFRGVILDAAEGRVDLEVESGRRIEISLAEIERANLIIDI